MRISKAILVVPVLIAVSTAQVQAQQVAEPSDDVRRTTSSTSARAVWTQFLGAAVEGGDSDAKYGGKLDGYVAIDGRDLGLWDGLTINAHPEIVYGRNVNGSGAPVLLPPNVALSLPSNNDEDFDLSLYLSQRIGEASLSFGKINMLDIAATTPLVGGGGLDGFQHTALATPPSGITPATIFGALLSIPLEGPKLTLGVWDPATAVNRTGFEDPFETGVAGMASLTVPVPLAGKPGFHTFSVQGTTIRGLNLADIQNLFLPQESEDVLGQRQGGWKFTYAIQQYLWTDPADTARGWGLFGTIALWEDNPLPFEWSATVGLTGSPPIASRQDDRFGIAYHRIILSPALREGLAFLIPIGSEQGVEAFYTFQVGRHLRLTADVQWIDPFVRGADNAVFLGVRAQLAFQTGR